MLTGIFNPKLFNPVYWHLIDLLADHRIRFIELEGGSSAAKTFSICQAIIMHTANTKTNAVVFRRFHVHIKDSVYASFRAAISHMDLTDQYIFQQDLIKHKITGTRIVFKGLDNEENIKGIEDFDIVYNNEWNQFLETHWKQQRKRLRGRPNQKFICDWNPVSANMWLYENWIDREEWIDLPLEMPNAPTKYNSLDTEFAFKKISKAGNHVNMKVTYRDNFWIVGHPSGKGGFDDVETKKDFEYDRIHDNPQYRIYANGERGILRTGGEFWKQYNPEVHQVPLKYEPLHPVHVSFDENVVPYLSIGIFQVIGKEIRMIHEIPCKHPNNNAPKAAEAVINWLISVNHNDVVFIYGDPSGRSQSTVDENSKSFFDKFFEKLQNARWKIHDRVLRSAPQVALSGAFINEIFEKELFGWKIRISDKCRTMIDDLLIVKEAPDGTMFKKKFKDPDTDRTYEPNGHYSDLFRYFMIELLKAQWDTYRKKPTDFKKLAGLLR